jgi:CO dehydrogenase nickel-insertion accessory protein CooC1
LTLRNYREARTRGAVYVLNKVPDPDTEHFLWQRLLAEEINVVASIHDDSPLRQAWLEGKPLRSAHGEAEAAKIVRALEQKRGAFAGSRVALP